MKDNESGLHDPVGVRSRETELKSPCVLTESLRGPDTTLQGGRLEDRLAGTTCAPTGTSGVAVGTRERTQDAVRLVTAANTSSTGTSVLILDRSVTEVKVKDRYFSPNKGNLRRPRTFLSPREPGVSSTQSRGHDGLVSWCLVARIFFV